MVYDSDLSGLMKVVGRGFRNYIEQQKPKQLWHYCFLYTTFLPVGFVLVCVLHYYNEKEVSVEPETCPITQLLVSLLVASHLISSRVTIYLRMFSGHSIAVDDGPAHNIYNELGPPSLSSPVFGAIIRKQSEQSLQ